MGQQVDRVERQREEGFCLAERGERCLCRRVVAGNDDEAGLTRLADAPPGAVADRDLPLPVAGSPSSASGAMSASTPKLPGFTVIGLG